VAVEDGMRPALSFSPPPATVIRNVLLLPAKGEWRKATGVLLDASGRKVLCLHPGANDVRALAPGVYFVKDAQAQAIRKVVITR